METPLGPATVFRALAFCPLPNIFTIIENEQVLWEFGSQWEGELSLSVKGDPYLPEKESKSSPLTLPVSTPRMHNS